MNQQRGGAAGAAGGRIGRARGPFEPGGRGRLPWVVGGDGPGFSALRRGRRSDGEREADARPVRVELFGRADCHLCDEAREVVARIVDDEGAELVEHDIDADPALREKYSDYVPVVVVEGRQHATWRVDAKLLGRAIRAARRMHGLR